MIQPAITMDITATNTYGRLAAILEEQLICGLEAIRPEAEIMADLGADSLDAIELTLAIEDEFGIEITDEEQADAKTVALIDRLLAEAA
jgi:acyl carrier protein